MTHAETISLLAEELRLYEPLNEETDPEYPEGLLFLIIREAILALSETHKSELQNLRDTKWLAVLGKGAK